MASAGEKDAAWRTGDKQEVRSSEGSQQFNRELAARLTTRIKAKPKDVLDLMLSPWTASSASENELLTPNLLQPGCSKK
jgi:hypothetical protein